jgi:2-oxoglutarate dehydrogenase E1 component
MSNGAGLVGPHNLEFVEALLERYSRNPEAVPADWRAYFEAEGYGSLGQPVTRGSALAAPGLFGGRAPKPVHLENGNGLPLKRDLAGTDASDSSVFVPYLQKLAIFRDLPDEELRAIARVATPVNLQDGQLLFREGSLGKELYIILDGRVAVARQGNTVATLSSGDVVGELALFDQEPRSASAMASGGVALLQIHGDDLHSLIDSRPVIARTMIRVLTRRVRDSGTRQDKVDQLIRAYRVRGHLLAHLDPLGPPPAMNNPELDPAHYGLSEDDLDTVVSVGTIPGQNYMKLRDVLTHLRNTYCRSIGVQFMHIDDVHVKFWLQERMEATQNACVLTREEQIRILTKLTDAEILEQFIHKKFTGAKRFSLEGAESLIPLLDLAIQEAGNQGVEEFVIGMPHRGRLNVLANIMNKSPKQIFREFDDTNPDRFIGSGDVKYHLGHSADVQLESGKTVHLSLSFNPSHLEFVSPVVLGRVRAKQDRKGDAERKRVLGIVIHGDAAFAGQGVVQEMFNMSELHGFRNGGTVHIIVNNQVGFTTDPNQGRSTVYCTDVARMLQIPILHVNGERPEAVAQVVKLAMEFRREFSKDVVIDMYCYRRYGHNEGDEPAFTQPLLYQTIRARKSVREGYLENLTELGEVTREEADRIAIERRSLLEEDLTAARSEDYQTVDICAGEGFWVDYQGGRDKDVADVDTRVPRASLVDWLRIQARVPPNFHPHPKIERILATRLEMAEGQKPLDWAAAESLAFASIISEGHRVRLIGQDSQRGTFSHRHAVLHDVQTGERFVPLKEIPKERWMFEAHNSPLTEVGVVGFEYGYSLDYPDALLMWEAQFGDFANVAQVIIDQFITSGEDKWRRWSGLVMLLPHGFEGQGPEHSSARLERFLSAAAEDNIQVVNLTTPAQFFHALRRQVLRPIRKPLIVMSPKSLLRHPRAVSTLDDLAEGSFEHILADGHEEAPPSLVNRVLLTSGKIYYELLEERTRRNAHDVAIVRMEQYYPLRMDRLASALAPYRPDVPVVWVQEEPRNMGAWSFLFMRFADRISGSHPFSCVSRPESASPATGSHAAHAFEQQRLMEEAFRPR